MEENERELVERREREGGDPSFLHGQVRERPKERERA